MKTGMIFRISMLVICLFISVSAAYSWQPERGIIILDNLQVRTYPDPDSEITGILHAGEIVNILEASPEKDIISNMEDYWYRISTDSLEGWIFGYFISPENFIFPESNTVVHYGENREVPGEMFYHVIAPYEEHSFTVYDEIVEFSPSGRYYYMASVREGYLQFFDSAYGESIADGPYTGGELYWEGDTLEFEAVMDYDPEFGAITEWIMFDDGIIHVPGMDEYYDEEYYDEEYYDEEYYDEEYYDEEESYWERWTYFYSVNPNEKLYHVRVNPGSPETGEHFRVVFLGVTTGPQGYFNINLYEHSEVSGLYQIDTLPDSYVQGDHFRNVEPGNEHMLKIFIRQQSDNLILSQGRVYYYKNAMGEYGGREYFSYHLGSMDVPVPVSNEDFLLERSKVIDIYNVGEVETTVMSYYREKVAFTNTYDIYIAWDFEKEKYNRIRQGEMRGWQIADSEDGFRMSDYLGDNFAEGPMLIGSMCWDYHDRFLFFDNSGMDYRCIWMFDTMLLEVEKIVPEHEAVQPFYYELYGESYVAYTEWDMIKIATSLLTGR